VTYQYAAFWKNPSVASPIWLALLFSVLSIATCLRRICNVQATSTANATAMPALATLQESTMQCLILGKYATASSHALEAFILHGQSCMLSGTDPIDMWFEFGLAIRMAIRLGYHRDPCHLKGITPFEGEMRRRVWLNVFQVDALISFQMGFPSMIPTEFCDCEVPRNLEYSDLDPAMHALPSSRPLSDETPMTYTIVKASVMSVFKKIVAHTQALSLPHYEHTLALDAEIREAYKAIPSALAWRDVRHCPFTDNAVLIWQRCTVEVLYLKGLIILHRGNITYDNNESQDPHSEHSRGACMEAAITILARQADLASACEPGGRLFEDRWMMRTLPAHDFLLGAMVVCLDLSMRLRVSSARGAHLQCAGSEYEDAIADREYQALRTSHQIWSKMMDVPEACIAALTLGLMLKKVEVQENLRPTSSRGAIADGSVPEIPAPALGTPDFTAELFYADSMAQMIDGSEDIDWVSHSLSLQQWQVMQASI
jgi:hypothetical protein